MNKNKIIKISLMAVCVILFAGIVLGLCLLPKGPVIPQIANLQGTGTSENPYQISSQQDFQTLAEFFNNNHEVSDGNFEITNDITLQNFIPIGGFGDETSFFSGNFNANGKTITIESFDESCKGAKNIGLFGRINTATIENLTIEGTIISGTKNTGGLAGEAGTINVDSCIFNGKMICAGECTGGLIGAITSGEKGTISNCQSAGSFEDDPTNTNPVGIALGGIVGLDAVGEDFTNCSNTADISSADFEYLGGITGEMSVAYSGTINKCWNTGNISNTFTGSSESVRSGGISGYGGTIKNCYNLGYIFTNVSNAFSHAGGISSRDTNIYNCYNTGQIEAITKSLGYRATGIATEGCKIYNCYNIGSITGSGGNSGCRGGISAGDSGSSNKSTVSCSYYISSSISGSSGSYGGTSFSNQNSVTGGITSGTDTLLNKLNAWQAQNTDYSTWVTDNATTYPTLSAMARTITVNANGGSCSISSFYLAPSTTTYGTLPTPSRTGYTFAGWWTSASGGTEVTASTTVLSTTIFAHWTANTYTITLNNQSATTEGTASVTATYDSAMPSITVPARTGYTFGGYYTEQNGGGTQYYTASGTSARSWNLTSDKTLYAQWTPNVYTITLNNQSATTEGTTAIYEKYDNGYFKESGCTNQMSTTENAISIPQKTGYIFNGYYTNVDGSGVQYINASGNLTSSASNTNFSANGTLYAVWVKIGDPDTKSYTVAYNGNGATSGTMANSQHFKDVAKNLTANTYARTGYTFQGWATSNCGSVAYADKQSVTNLSTITGDTVILYAVWTGITYTVKYNVNNGSGTMANSSHVYGTPKALTENTLTRTGYTFLGWGTKATAKAPTYNDCEIVSNLTTTAGATVNLYAIWLKTTVVVTANANSGSFSNSLQLVTYDCGPGSSLELERPTRNGFRFIEYNTKIDGSGTSLNSAMEISDNITFYAQWEAMEYHVAYYDGSTLLKTDTIPANQQKALSSWASLKSATTTAEANGWVFHGWATSNSSFERAYENLAIIENITTFGETINLYAIYSKVLTVNYDGNGSTSGSVEADKSQTIYLSASRTMSNYSVTLKANEFARTNYHFSKWAFGSATGTQFSAGATFTQANSSLIWNNDSTFTKTFYAVWAGNSYTINYYNGTTKAGTGTYIYGTSAALKTFASLNQTIFNQLYGWKFSGWAIANNLITKTFNDGVNITNIDIGGSEITQGLTINLYAIYERTIAFHSGKNCATNSAATQTWNPYNTNASNISSVEAPVPTSLQEQNWTTLGYRADQSAGLATYAVTTTTTITPAVDSLCDLYAVYSKTITTTLLNETTGEIQTTTTTTYYNTSGDQTEITIIS